MDIPGCYSLLAHSAEEEVARDFLCFGKPDAVVVVCDATCLERNLNLVIQVLEAVPRTVVCVNLMDEAEKKKLSLDLEQLSQRLQVPVIGAAARSGRGLSQLMDAVETVCGYQEAEPLRVEYPEYLERAIETLLPAIQEICPDWLNPRWLCARLLDADEGLLTALSQSIGVDLMQEDSLVDCLAQIKGDLEQAEIGERQRKDDVAASFVRKAEEVCEGIVHCATSSYNKRDRKLDALFTSRATGFPIMLLLLCGVFWLTITGANVPSELLSKGLFWIEDRLLELAAGSILPVWLTDLLICGVYRVVAWIVSVMLPPMAIFFPLFTLLEDFGYLPRVAFNLDKCFQKCCACGKQALTMCMGFGCNAAGIVGCRIIDSPRERLIAMLTNAFVPCNGRFPGLIAVLTMFFLGGASGLGASVLSAVLLALVIVLGVFMTFLSSRILSRTILKGVPSSFTLELPPYRRPQIGKVIVRSIFDRTLFVLGRALMVAAPAGVLIWVMANVSVGGESLLAWCSGFLDPFARLLGMDGVILMAFILGFPANEIVIPIMIMAYMAQGTLVDISDLGLLRDLFISHGWTWVTAVSVMLFYLMHWPCSTTCLTVRKESGSWKWTAAAFLVPTVAGITVCFLFHSVVWILGLA